MSFVGTDSTDEEHLVSKVIRATSIELSIRSTAKETRQI